MENTQTEKISSIVDKNVEKIETNQWTMPTYMAIIILFIAFFIVKFFIYIKDDKRHGK